MRTSIRKYFYPICFSFRLLTFFKTVVLAFSLFIFSVNLAYADDRKDPNSYKENLELSGLLANEEFQFGLSCDEATQIYKLDKINRGTGGASLRSPVIGFGEGKTVDLGFFSGGCRDAQLRYVEKIVSINNGPVINKELFTVFIDKYGDPSFQKDNSNNIRYYFLYEGRYVEFRLNFMQYGERTVTIYELEDLTARVSK